MSDFAGGQFCGRGRHWGGVLVEGFIGTDVGMERRTYASSPLLKAAAPNWAQICGPRQCLYGIFNGLNQWPG
eukprot:1159558-Pelagomonas_calceolata.AAC.8